MALINCPKCGKQISNRAMKCPHCGFVLNSPQDDELPASSSDQQQDAIPTKARKKWWIFPIVVGILAIVVSLWFFSNKEKTVSEIPQTGGVKVYPNPFNTYFSGTIGTARGCLNIDNNGLGSYTYDCNGTDLTRNIDLVSYDEKTGRMIIKSFNTNGEYVGTFDGYLDNSRLYSGSFTNYKGVTIDFQLQSLAIGTNNHTATSSPVNTNNTYSYRETNGQNNYVVIDGSELRLRLGPSTNADTFKWGDGTNRHPKVGEKFKYLDESGDFYQIDFHGHHLWVSKLYTHIE